MDRKDDTPDTSGNPDVQAANHANESPGDTDTNGNPDGATDSSE